MKTYSPDEVLKPGEIFEEIDGSQADVPADDRVAYLVLGTKDILLHVAELGGENRDRRVVYPTDVPPPGGFKKWRFRVDVHMDRTGEYQNSLAKQLRSNMEFLRTAEELGGYTSRGGHERSSGVPEFTTSIRLHGGAFGHVEYAATVNGVQPTMGNFDLAQLGAIRESLVTRDAHGQISTMSGDLWKMTLGEDGVSAIQAAATRMGILMYPEGYLGAHMLPESMRDGAVSKISGYIPNDENPPYPRFYRDLTSAHAAVIAIHEATKVKAS